MTSKTLLSCECYSADAESSSPNASFLRSQTQYRDTSCSQSLPVEAGSFVFISLLITTLHLHEPLRVSRCWNTPECTRNSPTRTKSAWASPCLRRNLPLKTERLAKKQRASSWKELASPVCRSSTLHANTLYPAIQSSIHSIHLVVHVDRIIECHKHIEELWIVE